MKNKSVLNTKNIIAFVVLIMIWGIVIKNKFGFFNNLDDDKLYNKSFNLSVVNHQFIKDTFELSLIDRDPFLNTSQTIKKKGNNSNSININKKTPNQIIKQNITETKIIWPKVEYYGYVKNKTKNKQACLVKIESNLYQMHLGQTYNKIKLIKTFKDSIVISYNKNIKTILKQ